MRKIFLALLLAATVCEAALLALLPDLNLVAIATSEKKSGTDYLVPTTLAYLKLRLFGFRDCDAYVLGADERTPLVNFLASAYDSDNRSSRPSSMIAMAHKKGCSFNAYDTTTGLTPIHQAVLFNNLSLAEILISNGADIRMQIRRPSSKMNNLNAYEFAEFLQKKKKTVDYSRILKLLSKYETTSGEHP
jgi:Ankyrin repeat